jgi:fructokinase
MILVAGEALIDMTPARCGESIGYLPHPGGSPYNVAVGVGRLEVPVAFLGRLSTDAFGHLRRDHLETSQVSLRYLVDAEEATTLAFVHMGQGEPEYSFYSERTADRMLLPEHLPAIPAGAALHFGSISLLLEPGASTLEGLSRESRRRLLSLDPNVRPSLITDRDAYLRRLEGWVSLTDLIKVSKADLAWLYPHQPPEAVASRWRRLGPALVLVTLGKDGSLAVGTTAQARAATPPVEVVDTVGAGDAFTSAALAHLPVKTPSTETALRHWTRNSWKSSWPTPMASQRKHARELARTRPARKRLSSRDTATFSGKALSGRCWWRSCLAKPVQRGTSRP